MTSQYQGMPLPSMFHCAKKEQDNHIMKLIGSMHGMNNDNYYTLNGKTYMLPPSGDMEFLDF